jgi:hypothetical protein
MHGPGTYEVEAPRRSVPGQAEDTADLKQMVSERVYAFTSSTHVVVENNLRKVPAAKRGQHVPVIANGASLHLFTRRAR